MTPEQEADYRQLAVQMLDVFGDKIFEFLLSSLGEHKRLLDIAADGIWLGMRKTVLQFPPELLARLKPLKGTDRIQRFLLHIAPRFLMEAPIENIEKTMAELEPFLNRLQEIRKVGVETDEPNASSIP